MVCATGNPARALRRGLNRAGQVGNGKDVRLCCHRARDCTSARPAARIIGPRVTRGPSLDLMRHSAGEPRLPAAASAHLGTNEGTCSPDPRRCQPCRSLHLNQVPPPPPPHTHARTRARAHLPTHASNTKHTCTQARLLHQQTYTSHTHTPTTYKRDICARTHRSHTGHCAPTDTPADAYDTYCVL